MFIQKLNKSDFVNFIKAIYSNTNYLIDFTQDIDNMISFKKTDKRVVIKTPNIIYNFTDFDFQKSGNYNLIDGNHDKRWLKFMYGKFGDEYKQAFLVYRETEKQQVLERCSKKFDSYTEEFTKQF